MKIFTFCFDEETKQAAVAGNMNMMEALSLLQNLAINNAIAQARNSDDSSNIKEE